MSILAGAGAGEDDHHWCRSYWGGARLCLEQARLSGHYIELFLHLFSKNSSKFLYKSSAFLCYPVFLFFPYTVENFNNNSNLNIGV